MLKRVASADRLRPLNEMLALAGFALCGIAAIGCVPANAQSNKSLPESAASQSETGSGSLTGLITDADGGLVEDAAVTVTINKETQTTTTGSDGRFQFAALPAGSFHVVVLAAGRAPDSENGKLAAGQMFDLGTVVLHASADVSIEVLSPHGMAEVEVKQEVHQRVLGFAPNFYVAYEFNAPPLDARQKWELNWRTLVDPVNIGLLTVQAGVEQVTGAFSGFGPGPAGYGKRLGAASADFAIGNSLEGWILPIVFKQDPRYFYMGTGSKSHRFWYAVSTAVIARGDDGKRHPAYANVLGALGAGAASNLYYPAANRQGAGLTFENAGLSIGFDAVGSVLQELVLKHVSTGTKRRTQP